MPALGVVVVPHRMNGAEAKWKVSAITVEDSGYPGTKVTGGGAEYRSIPVHPEEGVVGSEGCRMLMIVFV